MSAITRAWSWTKRNAIALLATIGVVLGGAVAWLLHRQHVGSIRDQLAVEKAARKVVGLDARRKALEEREGDVAGEIAEVQRERAEVMREAVERARGVRELSDAELVEEWNDLYRGGRR